MLFCVTSFAFQSQTNADKCYSSAKTQRVEIQEGSNRARKSKLLHQIPPHRPHPAPLTPNIHGNSSKQASQLNPTNAIEHKPATIGFQPSVEEQTPDKTMQDILADVESDEGFAGVLPVRVDRESDACRRAERAAEGYDAEEDGGHDPVVALFYAPAEAHEARDSRDGDGDRHYEAEFGFVDAAVSARHEADDDIGDFASDRCADDAADEWADVYQTDLERGEVVTVAGFEDVTNAFGKHDEPSDGHGVDQSTPKDAGV
jgi:hypothetical protein